MSTPHTRKALLLVAHGSRREDANAEIEALAARLQPRVPTLAIAVAYLELAAPSVVDRIGDMAGAGMSEIWVLPYFLGSGTHVTTDIPRLLETAGREWPGCTIHLLPHLGADEMLFQTLVEKASAL